MRWEILPLAMPYNDTGKMATLAKGGSFYYLLVVDDFSGKMWVYFLWEKAEAFINFKRWHKSIVWELESW